MLAQRRRRGSASDSSGPGRMSTSATAAQVFEIPVEEVDEAQRSKAKMVNFIVYGLTGFDRPEHPPLGRNSSSATTKGSRRSPPSGSRWWRRRPRPFRQDLLGWRRPLPELCSNQAQVQGPGGAAGDEHRGARHRGRHHQDRDDPQPPGASRRRSLEPPRAARSMTNCFRSPAEEAEAVTELARREMVGAFDLTRRWRSTPAPARAGSGRSGSPDSGMSDSRSSC